MNKRYYYEDFLGDGLQDVGSFSFTEDEVIAFASQFDPQSFHTDRDAAAHSIYGGLIASGWHTCSRTMRLMCDAYLLETASSGSPGVENISWIKPVRPGDVIQVRRTTLEHRLSRSHPGRGLVLSEFTLTNQQGEKVMTMRAWSMIQSRETLSA
ncbi:MaoC family dehydratase [Achromobacter sp. GG226]|nr:MaoC family dehydratase [Verticiella sp. GG226]MBU4611709.1 MaoC family dehydratase [Verticiella sp. GG226]